MRFNCSLDEAAVQNIRMKNVWRIEDPESVLFDRLIWITRFSENSFKLHWASGSPDDCASSIVNHSKSLKRRPDSQSTFQTKLPLLIYSVRLVTVTESNEDIIQYVVRHVTRQQFIGNLDHFRMILNELGLGQNF